MVTSACATGQTPKTGQTPETDQTSEERTSHYPGEAAGIPHQNAEMSVRAVGRTAIRYYESLIDQEMADEIWAEGDREHA